MDSDGYVPAAKLVLHAFPSPREGAIITQREVVQYFRQRHFETSEATFGIRRAIAFGWINRVALNEFEITRDGMDELVKSPKLDGAEAHHPHA